MFEIPGSNISSVEISDEVVAGTIPPKYVRTSTDSKEETTDRDYESGSSTADPQRAVNN